MKKYFIFLAILFSAFKSFAQDKYLVDSLKAELKKIDSQKQELKIKSSTLFDTSTAIILYELSKAYWGNNLDSAMDFANKTLEVSEQIGYKKGIGNAYNSIGAINKFKGDYLNALQYFEKSLSIREEIGDKKGIAGCFGNIGLIYESQGNYPLALKNHLASLKMNEEIGNKYGMALSYNNIGLIYTSQSNFPEALKNLLAALKIEEEIGNKYGIAMSRTNIGSVYANQNIGSEALKNYFEALKTLEEIGDKAGISVTYNNIGEIYYKQGNYTEALKIHIASLKIKEEVGDKYGLAYSYNNIGKIYFKQNKYKEASDYLNKALQLSKEIGSLENIKISYSALATLDSAQGNYKRALEDYQQFIYARDSVFNEENTKKTVQQQMQYDFDKKESLTKAINEKELQKQRLERNGFMGGSILFLLLACAIFIGLRRTGKAKKKSEELLLNILPSEVANEIKKTGTAKAKSYTMVTVMFTDFKDFTTISEKISAELLVDEIHTCFSAFDKILKNYKIEKIKTIGDAYMCASGLPVSNYTHATDMLNAAFEIRNFMMLRKKEKEERGEIPFELRIGIHTGPVVAGIVGVIKYAYDIWGDTVNLAARMEQNSEAGKINISGSTYQLVKEKFNCTYRGKIEAKNKGEIDMYYTELR